MLNREPVALTVSGASAVRLHRRRPDGRKIWRSRPIWSPGEPLSRDATIDGPQAVVVVQVDARRRPAGG